MIQNNTKILKVNVHAQNIKEATKIKTLHNDKKKEEKKKN